MNEDEFWATWTAIRQALTTWFKDVGRAIRRFCAQMANWARANAGPLAYRSPFYWLLTPFLAPRSRRRLARARAHLIAAQGGSL